MYMVLGSLRNRPTRLACGQLHAKPSARIVDGGSKVRPFVEHVFARQKGPMDLCIRSIRIVRAGTRVGMANLVYNMQRYFWLQGRAAPSRTQPSTPSWG